MRAAVPARPAQAVAILSDDLAAAHAFAVADKAAETRRAYRSDFSAFAACCAAHGQPSLPAEPAIVAACRLIQDYLGHRDPRHNVHYTRTAGRRLEGLWRT